MCVDLQPTITLWSLTKKITRLLHPSPKPQGVADITEETWRARSHPLCLVFSLFSTECFATCGISTGLIELFEQL